jgi:hypothetical protein
VWDETIGRLDYEALLLDETASAPFMSEEDDASPNSVEGNPHVDSSELIFTEDLDTALPGNSSFHEPQLIDSAALAPYPSLEDYGSTDLAEGDPHTYSFPVHSTEGVDTDSSSDSTGFHMQLPSATVTSNFAVDHIAPQQPVEEFVEAPAPYSENTDESIDMHMRSTSIITTSHAL